jgi:hypothetical protein
MSAITGTERIYCPIVAINPYSIVTYPELISGSRPHRQLETYKENFKQNKTCGKVSKIAAKKISLALDYMLYTAKPKIIPEGFKGAGNSFKICFVTLTLSSPQIHTDKEIIKNILQPLLNYLRKHYKTENYIWRAEKQKNGNLHFHLLLDKWINYQDLRLHWNLYQQNLGYVSRYRDYQREFHKNGFKLRPKLLKYWSEERQYNAYQTGKHNDWNNPNSVDIHSTKRIKNLKKYLCKYLTKQPYEKIDAKEIESSHSIDLLSVDSRLWACSERLSGARGAKADLDGDLSAELESLKDIKQAKTIISDFYTITYISIKLLDNQKFPHIKKIFDEYIKLNFPDS